MSLRQAAAAPVREILAIRFARLGDVVLLLPALRILKAAHSSARLTLMTGTPYAAAARMCPFVDDVLAVDRHAMRDGPRIAAVRDIVGLVGDLRRRRFDLVVDFQSFRETNLLAWVSGARSRMGMKRTDRAYLPFCFNLPPVLEDKSVHVGEMFRRVALAAGPGAPQVFPREDPCDDPVIAVPSGLSAQIRRRLPGLGQNSILAIYCGASVSARRWAVERFGRVARFALESLGADVVVLTGISEEEERIGQEIVRSPGCGAARAICGLGIAEMAALIAECRLLVANDSGPMHLGPALGVPTLGIFSASLPLHYRPMGPESAFVHKERVEEIRVEEVLDAMMPLWTRATTRATTQEKPGLSIREDSQ